MGHYFPYNLQPARVEERREFYESEFDTKRAIKWMQLTENHQADLYVDVGTETTRYRPMFSQYLNKLVRINYTGEESLTEKLIKYRPEDIYYQRSYETVSGLQQRQDSQETTTKEELAFDLNPKGASGGCPHCQTRAKKLEGNKKLKALIFCRDCFEEVTQHCLDLYQFLDRHFHKVRAVFSGRGYHLHVRDREGFELDEKSRRELAQRLKEKYPIDPEVTAGSKHLMRLPGSLNGVVGKKAIAVSQEQLSDPEAVIRRSEPESFH